MVGYQGREGCSGCSGSARSAGEASDASQRGWCSLNCTGASVALARALNPTLPRHCTEARDHTYAHARLATCLPMPIHHPSSIIHLSRTRITPAPHECLLYRERHHTRVPTRTTAARLLSVRTATARAARARAGAGAGAVTTAAAAAAAGVPHSHWTSPLSDKKPSAGGRWGVLSRARAATRELRHSRSTQASAHVARST